MAEKSSSVGSMDELFGELLMTKPVLSICIPTYNRCDYLKKSIESITSIAVFKNSEDIQIIISDNCSTDETQKICEELVLKYSGKIKYIRQKENIKDKNFVEVLKQADGIYAKLSNDTLLYNENYLTEIIEFLKKTDVNVIFFRNKKTKSEKLEKKYYKTADDAINELTYECTWIGGLCVKTEKYKLLENSDRFSNKNFAQTDILARLANEKGIYIVNGAIMEIIYLSNKGGYNVAQVFGVNLIDIVNELLNENIITKKTYEKFIKLTLTKHISKYYFDIHSKFNFDKDGYFKYLLKYYKYKPYLYINYIIILIKKGIYNILNFINKKESYKR